MFAGKYDINRGAVFCCSPVFRANMGTQMKKRESFLDLVYEEQSRLAERELSAFIAAVRETYGPHEAKLAAEDWLDEAELMDSPPRSEVREWRSVTIAASARLANRVDRILVTADVPQRLVG